MDLKMVIFVCSPKMILIILTGQNKVLQQEIQNTLLTRGPMQIAVVPKKVGGFPELCAQQLESWKSFEREILVCRELCI